MLRPPVLPPMCPHFFRISLSPCKSLSALLGQGFSSSLPEPRTSQQEALEKHQLKQKNEGGVGGDVLTFDLSQNFCAELLRP